MMTAIIIRTATGQDKYLNIIMTAVLFFYRSRSIMLGRIVVMAATAAMAHNISTTGMFRMDIPAIRTLKNSHDKTFSALHTCMHIKAYDTHTVPYGQQKCGYFHHDILHTICKVTKNIQIARFL